jgi:hypothetical protein
MKKINKILNKNSTLIFILIFVLINFIFMQTFWTDLLIDRSKTGAIYGEVMATEWASEQVYQNLISGNNPFKNRLSAFYPFGTNFISTDSGYGFIFLILRPFLSVHQSFLFIVLIEIILANIGMYLLLKKIKISNLVSFFIALMYGYMTFLINRTGHLTYYSIFIFSWFFYFLISLIKCKVIKKKIFYSISLSLLFVFSMLLNLYYFVMLVLSLLLFLFYFLILKRKKIFKFYRLNMFSLITFIIGTSILLIPWLVTLYKTYLFDELPKTIGWGGAIEYSPDLLSFFIPSNYSYFFGSTVEKIEIKSIFLQGRFESFIYPGILILLSYFIIIFLLLIKKFPKNLFEKVKPYFLISIILFLFVLGPFLKVLGRSSITINEIKYFIPLPYIILHYIPFLSNIRVPGRIIVIFTFLAYIVSAFLIDYLFKKNKRIKYFLFIMLILIFIIDHYFIINYPDSVYIPNQLLNIIKNDKKNFTVMEFPYSIRDGLISFGDDSGLNYLLNQTTHKKSLIGGYVGRLAYYKSEYYQNNPLLGYNGRIADKDLPLKQIINEKNLIWKFDNNNAKKAADFLNIKYIIIDSRLSYTDKVIADIESIDYKKELTDHYFFLYKKYFNSKEYLSLNFLKDDYYIYLGKNWIIKDNMGYSGKKSSLVFKILKPRNLFMNVTLTSLIPNNKLKIYINEKKIKEIELYTTKKSFKIPVYNTEDGINKVNFIFSRSLKSERNLNRFSEKTEYSAKVSEVYFSDN